MEPSPAELRPSLDDLRRAALSAVEDRSLRAVALEIGMSAPGLRHFLDGGRPFERTRRKLLWWYAVRHPDADAAVEAAISLISSRIPALAREEFRRIVQDSLRLNVEADDASDAAHGPRYDDG